MTAHRQYTRPGFRAGLFRSVGLVILAGALSAPAQVADRDQDGIPDAVEEELGLLPDVPQQLVAVCAAPPADAAATPTAEAPADLSALEVCHVGASRFLLKLAFSRKPDLTADSFIVYIDSDNNPATGREDKSHQGVDLMVSASGGRAMVSDFGGPVGAEPGIQAMQVEAIVWAAIDAPLALREGNWEAGFHVLLQGKGLRNVCTEHKVVRLPAFPDRQVANRKIDKASDLRPLSDYRYYDHLVKLEKLGDKGLRRDPVTPRTPITFGRTRPAVPFAAARSPNKPGAVERRAVPIRLLDEAGVARQPARLSFGFPLPQGALYDTANVRILGPDNAELPLQAAATAFWPDDSLKWLLLDTAVPLATGQECACTVEFGSAVVRSPQPTGLGVTDADGLVTVVTGPLKVTVNKTRFNLLAAVWHDANADGQFGDDERVAESAPDGIRLVDERGAVFSTANAPPKSVQVEENGPCRVVLRVEGDYTSADGRTLMSYIVRLTFRNGSPLVTLACTHVDTCLDNEFTDITSLELPFKVAARAKTLAVLLPGKDGGRDVRELPATGAPAAGVFQADDQALVLTPEPAGGKLEVRAPGVAMLVTERAPIGVAMHEFWQRWPKAIAASGQDLTLALLPPQPGPDYGKGLPHYLLFPFVEGKYRFKWGMSITENVTLDFSGRVSPEELDAEVHRAVVPVVPADWYAETAAFGPVAPPTGTQFAAWDAYVAKCFEAHLALKEQQREYGFFNYGDSYGERGRNWTNNEYDFAHGLFIQFVRTGNRDYYRWALTAARHQANVDSVHAYPDPHNVGANQLHSIGHTGEWSQNLPLARWSHRYDVMTGAGNGHTWAGGMVDAWFLAGDPRVMEAAMGLGEHIVWAMSPNFKALGTHERSGGWSLHAIMVLYQAIQDPLYLEAAKRIADVALREQKFDEGGTWPHPLPKDHAGGHQGAFGNNTFLIGILLAGLRDYHRATHDPAVEKSIVAGTRWICLSWDESACGWPYSASPKGEPYYDATTSLNLLILHAPAYAALLTGEERFATIAENALTAVVGEASTDGFGKSVAQRLVFTGEALAMLHAWYATHRDDKGSRVLESDAGWMEKMVLRLAPAAAFRIRAPDEKVFWVKVRGPQARVTALRTPHGARPKAWPTGTLELRDTAGAVLKTETFDTDAKCEIAIPLPDAQPGTVLNVLVRDDQRSVWGVAGDNVDVVVEVGPDFSIGGAGKARYAFFVPDTATTFKISVTGLHKGAYGAAVIAPDNQRVAMERGVHDGEAQLAWAGAGAGAAAPTAPPVLSGRRTIEVTPMPGQKGKVWGLVLWAAGDLALTLEGVPPYLARTQESCFSPQ